MTGWFNDATTEFPFAKIGMIVDAENANSTINFSEGIFRKTSDGKAVDCFLYATSVTDVKKGGDSGWTFKPCPIYFQLHTEKYEKWGKDKKKEDVEPRPYTKFLTQHLIEKMGTESILLAKGTINFSEPSNSISATQIMSGVRSDGKPLSDDTKEVLISYLFDLEVITELEHLKSEALPATDKKGYSGGYGSKGESTEERLKAIKAFFLAEFGSMLTKDEIKTLGEFAVAMAAFKATDEATYYEMQTLISGILRF